MFLRAWWRLCFCVEATPCYAMIWFDSIRFRLVALARGGGEDSFDRDGAIGPSGWLEGANECVLLHLRHSWHPLRYDRRLASWMDGPW
jgi:hypothetical protein